MRGPYTAADRRYAVMRFELVPVTVDEKEILRNLMEKYDYEFTQYTLEDVNPLGLYGYDWLDAYWTQQGRWAYFLKAGGKLAGFVMVNNRPEAGGTGYNMAEFFVMYKYRRCGLGSWAAKQVFDRYKGSWQLKRHPKNLAAAAFWDKVIGDYTGGSYRLERDRQDLMYPDGSGADLFFFES